MNHKKGFIYVYRIILYQLGTNCLLIKLEFIHYSEGHDRSGIVLPGSQGKLVQQVKQQISNKPLIVVLLSGGSVDISNESVYIMTHCMCYLPMYHC